jgi:sulfur carrier protein
MNVRVNGRDLAVEGGTTLAQLVALSGYDPDRPGVAAALNDEVVPRSAWPDRVLTVGDRVEVLGAAQGG